VGAVGEGRGLEVGVGTAMGDVWFVTVAVGAGGRVAVADAAAFVGCGLDCLQAVPQEINASVDATRMDRRNLLGCEVGSPGNIEILFG
jgi:hypothetical protein